jgi:hypothetical protein
VTGNYNTEYKLSKCITFRFVPFTCLNVHNGRCSIFSVRNVENITSVFILFHNCTEGNIFVMSYKPHDRMLWLCGWHFCFVLKNSQIQISA